MAPPRRSAVAGAAADLSQSLLCCAICGDWIWSAFVELLGRRVCRQRIAAILGAAAANSARFGLHIRYVNREGFDG